MSDKKENKRNNDKRTYYSFYIFAIISILINLLYFIFYAELSIKYIPSIILCVADIFLLYNVVIACSDFSLLRLILFSVFFSYPPIALYSIICQPFPYALMCFIALLLLSLSAFIEQYKYELRRNGFIIKEFIIIETVGVTDSALTIIGMIINLLD